MKKMFWLWTGP